MRLYTRTGAVALDDPEYGHFEAGPDGGFDFPDELSDRLHKFAIRGKPAWETDIERQHRLMAEELERRRDPATLMEAVQQLVNAARTVSQPSDPEPEAAKPAPAKRASKRAQSSRSSE